MCNVNLSVEDDMQTIARVGGRAVSRSKQSEGVDFSDPGEELANKEEFRGPPHRAAQSARKRFVNAEKRKREESKYFVAVETK